MIDTERIENRNTMLYAIGLIIAGSGILSLTVGATYIICNSTAHFIVSMTGDSWMRALVVNRYINCWIGLMLLCLGTLLKWRAEDSQEALERTNRYINYLQ